MCKVRFYSPQDLRFVRELKEAFLVPHLGPSAMPRKVVPASISRSEGWYSRVLNLDETDWMPDLVDLRKITTTTGNREPLRVINAWLGEDLEPASPTTPLQLLSQALDADAAFEAQLGRDLADGHLDKDEARKLLPLAAARLAQAQKTLDAIHRAAEGR